MTHTLIRLMLSVRDAVAASGIGRTKLYELIGRGLVRAVKLDGKTLIVEQSLRAYLDSLPSASIKQTDIKASKRKTLVRTAAPQQPA
jgi:hypothetical protein